MSTRKLLTIITPSYNRAVQLNKLYESLLDQTSKQFIWLIVDDGSEDGTKEMITKFIQEDLLEIKYIKKKNGGKHTALNVGIMHVETPLTLIVDSDDWLCHDAVNVIEKNYNLYKNDSNLCAMTFLKVSEGRCPILIATENGRKASYIQCRIKENKPGDMAEVFFTNILKKYPFPEYDKEKFLSEDVVWIEMAMDYKMVFINYPIYVCEYLPGGLTDNDKRMKFNSPLGSMKRGLQLMKRQCGLKNNIKGAIIYNCYNKIFHRTYSFEKSIGEKILILLTKPLGCVFFILWGGKNYVNTNKVGEKGLKR